MFSCPEDHCQRKGEGNICVAPLSHKSQGRHRQEGWLLGLGRTEDESWGWELELMCRTWCECINGSTQRARVCCPFPFSRWGCPPAPPQTKSCPWRNWLWLFTSLTLIVVFYLSELQEDEAYCKIREMSSSSACRGFLYLWLALESLWEVFYF